jgi:hypothetical protein
VGLEIFVFYCSPIWTPLRAFFIYKVFENLGPSHSKLWTGVKIDLSSFTKKTASIRDCLTKTEFCEESLKLEPIPSPSSKYRILWNSLDYSLSIPDWRIVDIIDALTYLLSRLPFITAHLLAQVTDRIISMSPVIALSSKSSDRKCFVNIRDVNQRRTDNKMAKTKNQLTNNDLQNTTENKKIEQSFHSIMQTNISSRP